VIPTLPLALRNRLAETILRALHEPEARRELASLGAPAGAGRWLAGEEAGWADTLTARARAASAALQARPLSPAEGGVRQALGDAAVLFDAGLYFEVHEVLEPHWARATGATREALQGLIQAAVGWQHLANGNRSGAGALLQEGARRLRAGRLPGLDLEDFARATAEAAVAVAAHTPAAPPPFPRA
jgi:hypothetical protein